MNTRYGLNHEDDIFIYDMNINPVLRKCISCMMPILSIWYHILLFIANQRVRRREYKHKFSVCAIFKDETLILKEWIEYNLLIGVEHFYLYNNNSTDNYKEILKPYEDSGIVTLIEWNFPPPQQFPAYEHFRQNYWNETHWIAFIDLDEFIVPFRDTDIKSWIKKYKSYPAVIAYWKQFGTSGKIKHDSNKLIVEQYTNCWDKWFSIGKTFFNTDFDVYEFSAKRLHAMTAEVHLFGHKFELPAVNEFCKFIKFKSNRIGIFRGKKDFTIQINHYGTKAYDKYIHNKIIRGDVNNHVRNLSTFYWNEQYCTAVDFRIYRFMCELKIRLGKATEVEQFIKEHGFSTKHDK